MEITNSTALIPISYNSEEPTVLGRDLWKALEVKSEYAHWFKRMCEYGFVEGTDYLPFVEKDVTNNLGVHTKMDHQLTFDMAKEIAMIQRTPAGKRIRQYFIEVEKEYRTQQQKKLEQDLHKMDFPLIPDPQNQAIIMAGQKAQALVQYFDVSPGIARAHALRLVEKDLDVDLHEIKQLLPPVDMAMETFTPTMIAEKLTEQLGKKYTAVTVNQLLRELNLQRKPGKEWEITANGKRYGSMYPYDRNGHSGFQIRWGSDVVDMVKDHIYSKN